MEFHIDTYLADPVNPYIREKFAYILVDGTVIKFSSFNPNRGQKQSKGQIVSFLEADVILHSEEFYDRYPELTKKDANFSVNVDNMLADDVKIYKGVIQEVIELPEVITEDTPPEIINLVFASEMLSSTVLAWLFKSLFELNQKVENIQEALKNKP